MRFKTHAHQTELLPPQKNTEDLRKGHHLTSAGVTIHLKRVLVFVGTPGVGKSSISTLLASSLDGIHINIGELVKRERLYCGFDKKRESLIADEKDVGTITAVDRR